MTGTQARLTAMKKKYILDPSLAMPTGHIWATMMEPMAPAEAEKLRPRALAAVGKICWRWKCSCEHVG